MAGLMHLVNGNYIYILGSRTLNFSVMSLLLMQRLCHYAMDQYIIFKLFIVLKSHIKKSSQSWWKIP